MSWILGYVGKSLSRERRERLDAVVDKPLFTSDARAHLVLAGGIAETCLGGDLDHNEQRWCVVGSGVRLDEDGSRLVSSVGWRRRLTALRPEMDKLGGGFVALRIRSEQVEAFSDTFGLRTLYWLSDREGTLFSTRPDWLAQLVGGLAVDWSSFGSHWLTYNQLSSRSLVSGLDRLGPGGYATFSVHRVTHYARPYARTSDRSSFDLPDALRALLTPADPRIVSLGLSGGIDSRTLLSLRSRKSQFAVHMFGSREKADVRVALEIAEAEGLSFSHFHVPPANAAQTLAVVRDHAVITHAVSPASSALGLRYYAELRSQGKLVVDGAFGELVRRQFMNRLLRRGAEAIKAGDQDRILACIRHERARIFEDACLREMMGGARSDVRQWIERIESSSTPDLEHEVDLLNIHTRLPNFFGYEQGRLDSLVQCYMPFAHPVVIDAAMSLPSARRRGGRMAKAIITRRAPRLRRYPLVKGEIQYPYGLPAWASMLLLKIKARLHPGASYSERHFVLTALKEYILDRVHSTDVRQDPVYDWPSLRNLTETYYHDGSRGEQLDWWLAFDLWRSAIEDRPVK